MNTTEDPHYILIEPDDQKNPKVAIAYANEEEATLAHSEDAFIHTVLQETACTVRLSASHEDSLVIWRASIVENNTESDTENEKSAAMHTDEDFLSDENTVSLENDNPETEGDRAEKNQTEEALEEIFDENLERTAVFYAHPWAPTLFLTETVLSMIASMRITRGLVDLSGAPGLAVGEAFRIAGMPFDDLRYGQLDHHQSPNESGEMVDDPKMEARAKELRGIAGFHAVDVQNLHLIEANLVVIPAPVEPGSKQVYFGPDAMPGLIMAQFALSDTETPLIMIDTPERGLTPTGFNTYTRSLIHVEP